METKVFNQQFLEYLSKLINKGEWAKFKQAIKERVDKAKEKGILLAVLLFICLPVSATTITIHTVVRTPYKTASSYKLKPTATIKGISPLPSKPYLVGSNNLTRGVIENMIYQYFPEQPRIALAVATCESHLNPNAYSSTNDAGVFQVNLTWHLPKFQGRSPYDPESNIQVARQIYDASGWHPWVCYTSGGYYQYL